MRYWERHRTPTLWEFKGDDGSLLAVIQDRGQAAGPPFHVSGFGGILEFETLQETEAEVERLALIEFGPA